MRSRIWVCAAALLALGACSKKSETPTAAGEAAKPAVASAPISLTPPERKSGLWEQTMSSDKMSQTTKLCLDPTVTKQMTVWGQQVGKNPCSHNAITPKLGGGWEFNSTCDLGQGGQIVSHGVASGDLSEHYTVDIESTTTGASMAQANGVHHMKIEAAWKGPCPAGFKPGDMELPGGMKINMLAMTADAGGHPDQAAMRARARAMVEAMKKGQQQ